MPITNITDPNSFSKSASNNPNYYFAMVDMNKNEIFFMNQVDSNNYNKTLEAANDQTKTTPTGVEDTKNEEENQSQSFFPMNDMDKKFDRYFEDFP